MMMKLAENRPSSSTKQKDMAEFRALNLPGTGSTVDKGSSEYINRETSSSS